MRDALRGLTTRGRAFVAGGVAAAACAVALGQRDLLRVAVLLLAVPVLGALVVARTRYRLSSLRRLESARIAAGSDSTVLLRLENVSRLPTGLLLVEDKVPYALGSRPRFVLDRVEPRGRRDVVYGVRSDVRGRFVLGPLTMRLTDPFGMVELDRSFTARDTLIVTPAVQPLPTVQLPGEWAGSGDSQSRSIATAGEDDAGTREYRQGDELRRVHWRSTARRGELMVRREEQPWQSRATLLLDTRAVAHRGEGPASSFEWAVSAAASIGVHLVRHGYAVRLVTDSGASVSSAAHGNDGVGGDFEGALLDALSVLAPSTHKTLRDASGALRRGGGEGLLITVLGGIDADEASLLSRLRHGATAGLALCLDTALWAGVREADRIAHAATFDGSLRLLEASGWRTLAVGPGDRLPDVWPQAGRHREPLLPAGVR